MSEPSSDSESCPSFQTESESEHESNWDEKDQKEVDYTATAKEILCENVNITTGNALKLNSGYHNMLKVLKNKLEILLGQCQERQGEIEKQIEEYKNNKKPLVGRSRTSGYICGQPYFKDEDLYPGPHNDDYLRRKNVLGEFFPLDLFEATDTNWTVKDKMNILRGVKRQIVEFVEREIRLKIKKLGNGLEAERLRMEMETLQRREVHDLWERVKQFSNDYPGVRFEIDWLRVSNVDIGGRHSAAACVGLWNNYMLPGLVRDTWKTEEESILLDVVEKHGRQDWAQIAAEVPGRSAYQCFVHYQTTFSELAQIKRERWTDEEDAALIKAVDDNRIGSNIIWNKVVERMPLRNKIQCYNRYMFTLMRPTKNAKFTPEEDCVILAYVQQCGDDFRFIPPSLLPGRTNRQIWARYNHTLKYVNKHAGWTIEEDMRLMNFIKENLTDEGPRKISWAACSKALGNHSRLSCRTRYYTIEKFLEKNPDATLDDVPRKGKKLSSTVTNENWMKTFIDIRNEPKETNPEPTPTEQEQPSTSNNPKPNKRSRAQRKPFTESRARPFIDTIKCQIKRKFCHKLKYSFHYHFGDQMPDIQNSKVFCMNRAIFHLLNCTTNVDHPSVSLDCFTPNEVMILRSSLPIRFNPSLVNFLEDAKRCFLFPISYNTMLGMRGIVLNAAFFDEPNVEETTQLAQEDEADYRQALDTFRNRFRMIFHWSMLLAQENPGQVTFLDADEQPKPEYHLHKSFSVEQIALDQLAELCGKSVPIKIPPAPTIEEAISGMEQMELASPIKAEGNFHHSSIPGVPNVQIIAVKRLTDVSSVESIQIEQLADPPQQQVQIVSQPAPAPHYQLTYPIAPNALYQSGSTVVHGRSEELPSSTPVQFVGQITIINPQDLPAAQIPTRAVPVVEIHPMNDGQYQQNELESEMARTEHDDHDQGGKPVERGESSQQLDVFKDRPSADQTDSKEPTSETTVRNGVTEATVTLSTINEAQTVVELSNDKDATQTTISDPHSSSTFEIDFDVSIPANVVVPQQHQLELRNSTPTRDPAQPVSVDNRSEPMDTSATTMDSSGDPVGLDSTTDQRTTDSAPEDGSNSSSVSGWSDGGKSPRDDDLYDEEINSVHQVTSVTNVGEFVIQELQEPGPEPGRSSSNLDNSDGHMPEEKFTELSSQLLDDPEWDPERFETPKRTYSRIKKPTASRISERSSKPEVSDSHAWRWVHVDESDEDDVELHQSLWENCNPFRIQFSADDLNNSTETVVAEPKKDDIIVIDDDEVYIKEEPLDITESQTESPIDQAMQIQQIIETASNILRISEEYQVLSSQDASHPYEAAEPVLAPEVPLTEPDKEANTKPLVQTSAKDCDAVPPPDPVEVASQGDTDSLVVQTPSRVFDEQSNCYYFVDEIQDATALLVPAQTPAQLPATYWIYNGEEDSTEAGPSEVSLPPPETTQSPVPTSISDPQSPSIFQHTLDKIRTYAYRNKTQTTKQPTAAESPAGTNSDKKYWKPQSKSHRTESVIQSTDTRIRKPKRPPREATKMSPHQQHAVQTQALSLLEGLFKKPKVRRTCTTPSRMPPVATKYPRPTEAPKRPPSSSQYSSTTEQQSTAKKIKLETSEPFDAVDVISLLANDQGHHSKDDVVDEEESEYLAQLTMADVPQTSSTPIINDASVTL
ncbi:uncharacterized protein LOC109425542 [Aedes albopictus]|uniref:Uncharacterized protein n=1 Tax=Aedes albopictus TaxID=7160 RepID=A0ABM1Y1J4_AEDAL